MEVKTGERYRPFGPLVGQWHLRSLLNSIISHKDINKRGRWCVWWRLYFCSI